MNPKVFLLALFLICSLGLGGCGSPPQLGEDREAFHAVDALYTAVGLRDSKLVDQCLGDLQRLHAAGKLSDGANRVLERVAEETKDGEWERAQTRLSDFMEGQHR